MKNQLTFLLFLISILSVFAQENIVSGILTDESGPLPGVTIVIKGKSTGTETDFDGKYSITCEVGDILVYSFVGMSTKEVIVTSKMVGDTSLIKEDAVKLIYTSAYFDALKRISKKDSTNLRLSKTYNKNGFFPYERIKEINNKPTKVQLTYFLPDIYFEIGTSSSMGLQFVKKSNLPKTQNTFSQGRPLGGVNTYFGPESGEIYSYGPRLNTLEFNGNSYPYDSNGELVSVGNGSGLSSIAYNNPLYQTSLLSNNNLFFNVSSIRYFLGFSYKNITNKDLYNNNKGAINQFKIDFKSVAQNDKKTSWDAYIKYSDEQDKLPNSIGFQNKLLLNKLATPINFDNTQGDKLNDDTQRSFSPNSFNNPLWVLKNNRNTIHSNSFIASIYQKSKLSKNAYLHAGINYTQTKKDEEVRIVNNTVGFFNGYLRNKDINKYNFNFDLKYTFDRYLNNTRIKFNSTFNYSLNELDYSSFEARGFNNSSFINPTSNQNLIVKKHRNTVQFLQKFEYSFWNEQIDLASINNSYLTTIQNSKWLLPSAQLKINIENMVDRYWLSRFSIAINLANNVNNTPLIYANNSHNSLLLSPQESLSYTSNNDLFVSDKLKLEEKKSFELSSHARMRFFETYFNFEFTYFNNKTNNSVFPIFEQNEFNLANVADVKNQGIEISFNTKIYNYYKFSYLPEIIFSTYKTNVLKLSNKKTSIPIAGFSSVNKNLIEGQPVGVIVGSAFARDHQGNKIIDNNGFPMISDKSKIIGDPTPDYNIGFSNTFKLKKFSLNFVIDFQKGGDVWNGTQNTLNFLGTSEQSAKEREITGYIFEGVNQQGNVNTIPVDFSNPVNGLEGNRFVRYGFDGVAEEAIVDGSYINLKSIQLSFTANKYKHNNHFIKDIEVQLYGNNLFSYTKYKGASPYNNLFDQTSSQGLNFFNIPLISEVGFRLKIKI